jgi:hypothetical protein
MLAILILGLARAIWEKAPMVLALAMTLGGSISAYLMYRERSTTNDSPRLVAAQWSLFYWLGVSSLPVYRSCGFRFLRQAITFAVDRVEASAI